MEETLNNMDSEIESTSAPEEELLSDGAAFEDENVLLSSLKASEERYIRMLAEYDNFRKRAKKEHEQSYTNGFCLGASAFLPVIDNIDRACNMPCTDLEYKKGVELIKKQLVDILKTLKISEVGEVGDIFNPDVHNAVMHCEDENFAESTVCEVFQKGYKMDEHILRFATVKVAN